MYVAGVGERRRGGWGWGGGLLSSYQHTRTMMFPFIFSVSSFFFFSAISMDCFSNKKNVILS